MAKPKNNYVDNDRLYDDVLEYNEKVRVAAERGEEKPIVPDSIAIDIVAIARGAGNLPSYRNYAYIDDMISDGIFTVLKYGIRGFKPEQKNVFRYFNFIIQKAFHRKIDLEKKKMYDKFKLIQQSNMLNITSEKHQYDAESNYRDEIFISCGSEQYMNDFIADWEKKQQHKKEKAAERKKIKEQELLHNDQKN